MNRFRSFTLLVDTSLVALSTVLLAGCGTSPSSPEIVDYALVSKNEVGLGETATLVDPSLPATAGDVLRLSVVGFTAEGIAVSAPQGARIAWSGLPTVVVGDGSVSTTMGSHPNAIFIDNEESLGTPNDEVLVGLLDSNTQQVGVTAELSGVSPAPRILEGRLMVGAMAVGDANRGSTSFSENCASCHGATGRGGAVAPPLSGAPGTMAGDPGWTAPVFAVGVRVGMDARGVPLHPPMPAWLTEIGARGELLGTRDFADIYEFLRPSVRVSPGK